MTINSEKVQKCFDAKQLQTTNALMRMWEETLKPAEGLGGGTVVQGSAARLVRLIDLSASVDQGHGALVPPISSRIVQRCPARRRQMGWGAQSSEK